MGVRGAGEDSDARRRGPDPGQWPCGTPWWCGASLLVPGNADSCGPDHERVAPALSSARRRGRVVGPTRGVAATLECQTRRWSLARLSEQATPEQDETPAMWPEPGIDPRSSPLHASKGSPRCLTPQPTWTTSSCWDCSQPSAWVLPGGGAGRPRRSLCALRVEHRRRGGGTVPHRHGRGAPPQCPGQGNARLGSQTGRT